jgi:molybdate transport system substrate-binding protein
MAEGLTVLCARSMTSAVNALTGKFMRATGREVAVTFGTVGALQAKLEAGETADVLILGAPALAKLEQAGALVAGSRKDIARTSIGVAVREGTKAPDISTGEAFRQALIGARAVAFSDAAVGGSAGVHLARLFGEMGLAETIEAKGLPQKNGAEVASRVAEGSADIGMTLIAEIVPIQGAHVIGPLPRPLGNDAVYGAAVSARSDAMDAACAFIAALTRPDTHELWEAAGFGLPKDRT